LKIVPTKFTNYCKNWNIKWSNCFQQPKITAYLVLCSFMFNVPKQKNLIQPSYKKTLHEPPAWRHPPLIRAPTKGTRSLVARAPKNAPTREHRLPAPGSQITISFETTKHSWQNHIFEMRTKKTMTGFYHAQLFLFRQNVSSSSCVKTIACMKNDPF
jgi:hypothetical protein